MTTQPPAGSAAKEAVQAQATTNIASMERVRIRSLLQVSLGMVCTTNRGPRLAFHPNLGRAASLGVMQTIPSGTGCGAVGARRYGFDTGCGARICR